MRLPAALSFALLLSTSAPLLAAPAPSFGARIAGLDRHEGLVPWYWDAKGGKLLLELPRPGTELLYSVGIAEGAGTIDASLDRGQLGGTHLVRFERVGPRVLLVQQQLAHRSSVQDAERTRAISESFPSAVLASFKLEAEDGARLLVDATDFVLRDEVVLPELQRAQPGAWKQNAELSALRPQGCGAFPRNTEIEALLTFTADQPSPGLARVLADGRTMSVVVHHTFMALPPEGYSPRAADPRIGYFFESFQDLSAPYTEPIARRWIARWRLVKKNAGAALSEPVEPIVYYLDRGLPAPERATVQRAALCWNHAFEQAGFQNALVLRDLPVGATFLDARYSGIQWTHRTERAWSIGQSQTDPRTGEILHAVVLLDSHRRRTTDRMWRNMEPRTGACAVSGAPDVAPLFARAAAGAETPESTLVLARLAYLTAHEIGHTLGLGHNMAATTFGWGSVMDYLAPHLEERGGAIDPSDAYPGDVGSYDRLAIEWGYGTDGGRAALDRVVREGYARGIVYPLDVDARWNEYDFGDDPAGWLATSRRVRQVLMSRFGLQQLRAGEPVYSLQERFSLAYLYHRFALAGAQHAIGGERLANALAGDGQVPRAPVPPAMQRRALEEVLACISPAELEIPARIEDALIPPPIDWSATRERFASDEGDAFSRLEAARTLAHLALDPLFEPARASTLARRTENGVLTLGDVLRRVLETTWLTAPEKDLRAAQLQRVAQRAALDAAITLAASEQASIEARALALAGLQRFAVVLRGRHGSDPAGEAHLRLAERDLTAYLSSPATWKGTRAPTPPPGRPVGGQ